MFSQDLLLERLIAARNVNKGNFHSSSDQVRPGLPPLFIVRYILRPVSICLVIALVTVLYLLDLFCRCISIDEFQSLCMHGLRSFDIELTPLDPEIDRSLANLGNTNKI